MLRNSKRSMRIAFRKPSVTLQIMCRNLVTMHLKKDLLAGTQEHEHQESVPVKPKPLPIFKSPIPGIISSAPLNWADDAASFSTIPTIPLKTPRDLSGLCSTSKNPFSSFRRCHRNSKHQQTVCSYQYTQPYPTCQPSHHSSPLTNLDWHRDPCLFELSHVLRTLGWSHP